MLIVPQNSELASQPGVTNVCNTVTGIRVSISHPLLHHQREYMISPRP